MIFLKSTENAYQMNKYFSSEPKRNKSCRRSYEESKETIAFDLEDGRKKCVLFLMSSNLSISPVSHPGTLPAMVSHLLLLLFQKYFYPPSLQTYNLSISVYK